MGWRWVPAGHRTYDPADPDLVTITHVLQPLGYRLTFVPKEPKIWWAGPWFLLNPNRNTWIRIGVDENTNEIIERAVPIAKEIP